MVPGIAPTADPMLQARMFSYPDAARYRLGVNYQQLPTNSPLSPVYSPYQRDGAANFRGNYGADPNYVGNTFKPVRIGEVISAHDEWTGRVSAYSSEVSEEDFEQARMCWKMFGETGQQEAFVGNVASHLGSAVEEVQVETVSKFMSVRMSEVLLI